MMTADAKNNESRPTVSVVMIAYNKELYIDEAIAGVVKQKGDFRLQLIIMDDCSTDRTADIALDWQQRYPDIIEYHRNARNLGLQGNYLAAFRLVTADYMAICDADDYWFSSRKLARQIDYMERHPDCALTFHRVVNYYEASGEKSLSNGGQQADCTIRELSRSNFITNLSVLYRRRLVDLHNLPDWISYDRSPDYAMHMLYAEHGTIHYFSRPMGVYRKTAGSSWSMTEQFERLKMSLIVRRNLLRHFQGREDVENGLHAAATSTLRSMGRCADSPERAEYVRLQAKELGVEVEIKPADAPKTRRSLPTRIRAALSKFIMLPRP